jgi:cephalosporin-C deacetylase-like acetyl esterase
MYHALADTMLANSLLRSLPEVDATKIGVMGVSWGGVITSTVIGLDERVSPSGSRPMAAAISSTPRTTGAGHCRTTKATCRSGTA